METQRQPLRVAQILGKMDSGGIEAVVLNYYRHIDRSRLQFDFYYDETSSAPQRAELERLGAGLYPIPAYTRPVAYHRALFQAFQKRGYGIVHSHLGTMALFSLFAAWRAGVPVRVCHIHSTAHWGEGAKTLLKYALRPFAGVFANRFFACGQAAARWMYGRRRVAAGGVAIMPNAIEAEKFAYSGEARAQVRRELGIPPSALVVGHVGRFAYPKNHGFLVDIFAELCKARSDARLLLVGEGELLPAVKAKAQALGVSDKVVFAGVRRDVNLLYSAMDVFCLPSFYEGFPVVAIEAQANGVPCLFSGQMTKEVLLTPEAQQLPLTEAQQWVRAMQKLQRRDAHVLSQEYDIFYAAQKLQDFYEQKGKGTYDAEN